MTRSDQSPTLRELGERYALPEVAIEQLQALVELVARDPLAPTTVRGERRVLEDHLADSLVALELPLLDAPRNIVDIGSGAGFPGLVMAIARPAADVALVEAAGRKCTFIDRAVAHCEVRNARVVNARAESWTDGLGSFELATARAVARLPVVLEYAAPLLQSGGSLIAWRGRRDLEAETQAARAGGELGLELGEVRQVRPYAGAMHRHLHLATKVAETPAGFPRRPGVAARRPLGGPV
jgi:16S rRNA (guanine527-N7)-methyltransferase